jgi:hypothetical protein
MLTFITAPMAESGLTTLRQYGEVRYEPWTKTRRIMNAADLINALTAADVFITEADNLPTADNLFMPGQPGEY